MSIALVVAVACAVHLGALGAGFVFDDHQIIEGNPLVTQSGHLQEVLTSHYWHPLRPRGYLYRPFTVMSFRLDHWIGSGRPVVFHATSIALHAMVSALVFLVLARIYPGLPAVAPSGALLFATHPVHVEAVAGIAGRADLLAALGTLAAWWLHLRGRRVWSAAAFLIGALSKESAIVTPGLLLAGDLCLGRISPPGARGRAPSSASVWRARYGPVVAATVVYVLIRVAVLGSPGTGDPALISALDNPLVSASVIARVGTSIKVLAVQARLLFFPWALSSDYSFDQIPLVRSAADPIFLAGLCLVVVAALVFRLWGERASGPGLPLAAFFIAVFPVSNLLVPVGTILAERTLYLPSFGFCAGAGLALAAVSRWSWNTRRSPDVARQGALGGSLAAAGGIALLLAGLAAARTVSRVPDWRDDISLFSSAARASPRCAKAHYNIGITRLRAGDAAGALPSLERSVEIARGMPERVDMMRDLASALGQLGRVDEAVATLERARYLSPSHVGVLVNLGNFYATKRDLDRAFEAYEAALRIDPSHAGARMNRGRLLLVSGRATEAVTELERAARDAPSFAEARYNLADAYLAVGRIEDSVMSLREFLRLAGPGQEEFARLARERLVKLEGSGDATRAGEAGESRPN